MGLVFKEYLLIILSSSRMGTVCYCCATCEHNYPCYVSSKRPKDLINKKKSP